MSAGKPQARVTVVIALVLMLAALGVRFWASERAAGLNGPSHIAAHDDVVVVHVDHGLLLMNSLGEITHSVELAELGINDAPIDLRLLSTSTLLIASQQPARVRLCGVPGMQCQLLPIQSENAPRRQFKLLPMRQGEGAGRFWLSDAQGDRLWRYSMLDGSLSPALGPGELAGPNELVLDRGGSLWIADTDNRRLLELVPGQSNEALHPGREHDANNELTVENRYYPMMLDLGPDGRLWAMVASDFSIGRADLVVYDASEGPMFRVNLPGSVFVTDLVRFGKEMLVTDMDALRIYRVNPETLEVRDFGGQEFRQRMDGLRAEKERFRLISLVSLILVVASAVLMIAAAVKSTPKEKRFTPQPELFDPKEAETTVVAQNGVHWLRRRPLADRLVHLSRIALTATLALTVASLFALTAWLLLRQDGADDGSSLRLMLSVLGMLGAVAALAPTIYVTNNSLSRKLGSDGKKLHLRLEDGRGLTVAPEELHYTNRALLYRQYFIPLKDGRMQSLYEDGEIEAYLTPLLLRGKKLGPVEGLLHQWRNRDKVLLWTAFSTGALLALGLIFFLYS